MPKLAFPGVVTVLLGCLLLTCCSQAERDAEEASRRASDRKTYIMRNDVEFRNYNRRQQIADDPSTVLWCTVDVGTERVTVPIVGKLTSSHKRPFGTTSGEHAEHVGPDAMFGDSGDYRYGFGPTGVYFEQFMGGICFDRPMKWQTSDTKVILDVDMGMLEKQDTVRAVLRDAAKNGHIDPSTGRLDSETMRRVTEMLGNGPK